MHVADQRVLVKVIVSFHNRLCNLFFFRHVFENSSGKLLEIPFIPITNTKESYEIVREKSEEEKNTLGMRSNFIFDEISKNYMETIILEYLHTLGTPGIAYNFYIL